jgi:para-nitrobenzyl esterase
MGGAQSLDSIAAGNKRMMDYFKKTTLEDMRAISFEELNKMSTEYSSAGRGRMGMMSPITDKYFLMGSFSDAARANEIPDIPYMFGYTANDMNDMAKPIADFARLRNEKSKQPVYAYIFSRQLPEKEGVKSPGAFHSSDLWYIFHSFKHSWRPFTAGDKALSLKMVDFWTNFAKYGDPNGKGQVIWTPFTKESPKFITLDVVEGDKASFVMTETPKFLGGGMPR